MYACIYIRKYHTYVLYIHTYVCKPPPPPPPASVPVSVTAQTPVPAPPPPSDIPTVHTYYVLINPPIPYITSSPLCLLHKFRPKTFCFTCEDI